MDCLYKEGIIPIRKFSRAIILGFLLILSCVFLLRAQDTTAKPKSYKFTNGQWFNGISFTKETWYVSEGVFTKKKPLGIVESIDLKNGYVIPPFAEVHNHNIGGGIFFNVENNEKLIQRFLSDGVFYIKIPGNPAANAHLLRQELINRKNSVDVAFSNAVLTSPDGHPIGMTLASYKQAGIKVPTVSELDGQVYFVIASEADLENKWAKIIGAKPDFIKIIMRFTEDYEQRRNNPELFGKNGLDPALIPKIVRKAHQAGLAVSAHVDTKSDFKLAVRANVDEINHLPGPSLFEPGKKSKDYLITGKMARQVAKKNINVVTTTAIAKFYAKNDSLEKIQAVQRKNLRILTKHHAKLAIGSDNFMDTSQNEVLYLKSLQVFSNLELMKMWCEISPQSIFPERKIGKLKEGYEASFLVLSGNPIENFDYVKDIKLRFKQGMPIEFTN